MSTQYETANYLKHFDEDTAEDLGRRVRDVWVEWAAEQPDPKPSWLTPWDDIDEGQQEVDRRIGTALAMQAAQIMLPAWEARYEPGNVSETFIGYCNDEASAKAAAESWLRAQKLDEVGELRWAPQPASGRFGWDVWAELAEIDEDGQAWDTGIHVRHRMPIVFAPAGDA